MHAVQPGGRPAGQVRSSSGVDRRLCWGLAMATSVGGALTALVPSALHGTAAMNGSARGTALAMIVLGVPALLATTALVGTRTATARVAVIRIGVVGFLVYNSVMLLFGTPFNAWFLIYVAMLGLSLATLIVLCVQIDPVAIGRRFTSRRAARWIAAYLMLLVVGNALIWLRGVIPALARSEDPGFLVGTGLTTSPTYVQDLSFWLPLAGLSAFWLWNQRPWGVVLAGAFLSMWVLEGLCVALDQWVGSQADPQSPVVSSSMVLPFVILAAITLVVLRVFARSLPEE